MDKVYGIKLGFSVILVHQYALNNRTEGRYMSYIANMAFSSSSIVQSY
jgi:hypothetical protein